MKFFLIALFSALAMHFSSAITYDDLVQGSAVASSQDKEQKLDAKQQQCLRDFRMLYSTFITTVDRSVFFVRDPEYKGEIYKARDWMRVESRGASSLLNFISDSVAIGTRVEPHRVIDIVSAWYLWNCENSDEYSMQLSIDILENVLKGGYLNKKEMELVLTTHMIGKIERENKLGIEPGGRR
jgi:hypothetical protein